MNTSDARAPRGPPIRVLLADDHQLVRQGLAGLLAMQPEIDVVGEAADGNAAVALSLRLRPDVVLMDVNMPGLNGIDATRAITEALPQIQVIGLSLHGEQEMAKELLAAGAVGYVAKDGAAEDLVAAILALRRHDRPEDTP